MRDGDGKHTITPFSDALAVSGTLPINALNKIRIVQELGWPAAKRVLTDDNGHPLIVKKTTSFGFSSASQVAGGSTFMSGKMKMKNESSTSTPSVKSKTPKTSAMLSKPGKSMTASGQGEVVLRSSSSRLSELYKTEAFKTAWANEVRFHVARNLLHLRRYRQSSQGKIGKAMGTSQSAVARIESGQENITLDTLQRMIVALDGKFHVSIRPREFRSWHETPWWDQPGSWNLKGVASAQTLGTDGLIMRFERETFPRGAFLESAPIG